MIHKIRDMIGRDFECTAWTFGGVFYNDVNCLLLCEIQTLHLQCQEIYTSQRFQIKSRELVLMVQTVCCVFALMMQHKLSPPSSLSVTNTHTQTQRFFFKAPRILFVSSHSFSLYLCCFFLSRVRPKWNAPASAATSAPPPRGAACTRTRCVTMETCGTAPAASSAAATGVRCSVRGPSAVASNAHRWARKTKKKKRKSVFADVSFKQITFLLLNGCGLSHRAAVFLSELTAGGIHTDRLCKKKCNLLIYFNEATAGALMERLEQENSVLSRLLCKICFHTCKSLVS